MLKRAAALVFVASMLSSCMTWKPQTVSPGRIVEEHPDRIRVRQANGMSWVLYAPWIAGDTLFGYIEKPNPQPRRPPASIPLASIREVAVRRVSAARTIGLVVGLGVTAALIATAPEKEEPPPSEHVSCPLVYSWDGDRWRLDSGTFGGAITQGATRTDVDNLMYAVPNGRRLRLRLTNELRETDYVDAITVLAVDHEPGATVAPDPFGGLHSITHIEQPLRARDFRGGDALARVASSDGWSWESIPTGRDTARAADLRDGLVVAFARPPGAIQGRLVIDANNTPWSAYLLSEFVRAHGSATQAWYDSLDANPAMVEQLAATLIREAFLGVSVWVDDGWVRQGFLWEAGPEVVKRQVMSLDLSEIEGDSVRVRLESAPSFWLIDYVGIDYSPPTAISSYELPVQQAYDSEGRDVRALLTAVDRDYLVLERGDVTHLAFDVPDVPSGMARSYLLRSNGWYRIHTPNSGKPETALLKRVTTEPGVMSRLAVTRLNAALRNMAGASQ